MTFSADAGPAPLRSVVAVIYPGFELLDVGGPMSVFSTASELLGAGRGYRVEIAAASAGPIASLGGAELVARHALSDIGEPFDTLLVGGGLRPALEQARSLAPEITRLAGLARRTVGVCTGALLLADAGLLRGKRAVTHWAACDRLRRKHPECVVDPDPIYVRDGGVWTSAGVTAGMDLTLALVEEDHGRALALEAARWLVMYVRRAGGQSQASAALEAQAGASGAITELLGWVGDHLADDLSVEALAARCTMSARHFARVFRARAGVTPREYVERLRLDAARRELELGERSVKEVAARTGFGTVETLHRVFVRVVGMTPLDYRRRFCPQTPAGDLRSAPTERAAPRRPGRRPIA